jgi:hypothetical protein
MNSEVGCQGCVMDSNGSVTSFYEYGNEISASIEGGEFYYHLSNVSFSRRKRSMQFILYLYTYKHEWANTRVWKLQRCKKTSNFNN